MKIPNISHYIALAAFFFAAFLITELAQAETQQQETFTLVVQLEVDGLKDKVIFITDDGQAYVFDPTEVAQSEGIWYALQQARDVGIVSTLEIQTPCGVGK